MVFAHCHGSLRRGFTLIELLVVVVVLGAVAAFLLPKLFSMREEGRMSYCASNLRALGQGLTAYATDHDDKLPRYDNNGTIWDQSLLSYIDNERSLFVCPGDPLLARGLPNMAPRTYACNGMQSAAAAMHPFGSGKDPEPLSMTDLADRQDVILLGERPGKSEYGRYVMDGLIRGYVGRAEFAALDEMPGRVHEGGKGCNYLFVGMDVRYLAAEGAESVTAANWTIETP